MSRVGLGEVVLQGESSGGGSLLGEESSGGRSPLGTGVFQGRESPSGGVLMGRESSGAGSPPGAGVLGGGWRAVLRGQWARLASGPSWW